MMSFLIGVYCIYGVKEESQYIIRFVNSLGKYHVCEDVLKIIGCKNVKLIVNEAIPWTETIYFEPTNLLKSYFKKFEIVTMNIRQKRVEVLEATDNNLASNDISDLTIGLYILKIRTEKSTISKKMLGSNKLKF